MRAFRVDTDHITGAVDNIGSAADRLAGAKELLDSIHGRLQSSAAMSQDTDADNRIEDFRNRWKDEFGIIGDMLGKFKGALTSASDGYNGADQEMANAWNAPPAPPTEV